MADLREQLQAALGDSYRIDRELGGGGMSRVFLADETRLQRQVVIKVLPHDLAQLLNPERFEREIQIAARLQHPHVVPLLAAGESDGLRYYVMPWVEGESLRARLTRQPQPPLADAVRILRDIADGLAYAHAHGIVHRDIKPENILLSGDHAVVTDFGVAKALTDAAGGSSGLTSVGLVIGTPAYMAPEQAAADPDVGAGADVYALGVIGYEMLTGAALFEGGTPQALLAAHIARTPVPLAERRPDLPDLLTSLLDRCLAKAADARPGAAEITRELERPNTATAAPIPRRGGRSLVGRRPVAILGAVLVVVVLGALGVRAWRARGAGPPAAPALAVMPFTPVTPDTALTRLGRELSLTLGSTLDGVGDFRTVDPLTVLALVPEVGTPVVGKALVEVAQKLGATQTLTGGLVKSGDRVRLDLTLAGVGKPQGDTRVSVSGPIDSLAALTDSASWAIVKSVWKEGYTAPPRLDELTTRSLRALKAYLKGERFSVRGDFGHAAQAYREAFTADSGFILAYVGYVRARWWAVEPVEPEISSTVARNLDRLPEREALIQKAYAAPGNFITDSLLRQATVRWPNTWQTWYYHADHLTHSGELLGHSRDEAMHAWQKTVELNPNLFWAWQHLGLAALPYHPQVAREPRSKMDSLRPGSVLARHLQFLIQAWEADTVEAILIDTLASLARTTPAPDRYYPSSRAQVALEVNRRTSQGAVGQLPPLWRANARYWAMRGRWDSALSNITRFQRADGSPEALRESYAFAALGAWLGATSDSIAERYRERVETQLGRLPNYSRTEVLWFDGVRAFARDDRVGMSRAQEDLHQFLTSSSYGDSIRWAPDSSLAAFAMALDGRAAEAGQRLARLEWSFWASEGRKAWGPSRWSIGVNRLAAARWLAAAGDTTQAIHLLRWVDNFVISGNPSAAERWFVATLLFQPLTGLERAELLAGQGNEAEALLDLQTWLRQFDDPVPPLDAIRQRALRARARLEGRRD